MRANTMAHCAAWAGSGRRALPPRGLRQELFRREHFRDRALACPEYGGRMMLVAFIAEPTIAKRILDPLHLDSAGPPLAPAARRRVRRGA